MPFFIALLTSLAINAGIYLLTGFLTPGRKQDEAKPEFPTSDPNKFVPIIWGTVRLPLNIYRNAARRTEEIRKTRNIIFGFGPSDVIGHRYYYTLAGWLCQGGLSGVCDIIIDGKYFVSRITPQFVRDEEGIDGTVVSTVTDTDGNTVNIYAPSYSTVSTIGGVNWFLGKAPDGVTWDIKIPALFGDPVREGGVQGRIRIYPGDGSHNQNAVLQSHNPVGRVGYQEPSYPEMCFAVLEDVWLGNSGNPPGVEVVVCRASSKLSLGNPLIAYPNSPFGGAFNSFGQGDANPIGMIHEILINKKSGVGFPRALLDFGSFQAAYTALNPWEAGDDYGLSGAIMDQTAAEDVIKTILGHIDAVLFMHPTTGLLTISLIREFTGDPMTLQLLDESNLLSLDWNYSVQDESVNAIEVTFTNLYRDLRQDVVKVQNLGSAQRGGRINVEKMSFLFATRPDIALKIAQRELRVVSSNIGRGNFAMNRSGMLLVPGDHVRVSHPDVGTNVVCRVGAIDMGSLAAGTVSGSLMQDKWLSEPSSYVATPPSGYNGVPVGATPFYPPWVDVVVASDYYRTVIYNLLVNDPFGVVTAVEYAVGGPSPWTSFSGIPYYIEVAKLPEPQRAFWRVTYIDPNGVTQYLEGEFPQPVKKQTDYLAPGVSYAYVGTNVVVTVDVEDNSDLLFFVYGSSPPSDVTLDSDTPDPLPPTSYSYTIPAPTGTAMLYVAAKTAPTTRSFYSPTTRLSIPPKPSAVVFPIDTPNLSFVYSGANVIITATVDAGSTQVKFATAINTPPADATVLAATPDTSSPYQITVTAPLPTEMLHVGAAAGNGTTDSSVARLAIPPKPDVVPPTIQYPFGNGTTMGSATDWLAASPAFAGTVIAAKARFLNGARAQVTGTCTFSIKKVLESTGALVDMVGGVLTLTGVSELSFTTTGWTDNTFAANDEIIATLETLTNPNSAVSLLLTLTLQKT